jgi:hypothetical protein
VGSSTLVSTFMVETVAIGRVRSDSGMLLILSWGFNFLIFCCANHF